MDKVRQRKLTLRFSEFFKDYHQNKILFKNTFFIKTQKEKLLTTEKDTKRTISISAFTFKLVFFLY